jgi:tRNA(Ile)-lysidine synthase
MKADHPLLQKVIHTIERHGLISRGEKVLVAVSGGPDSVALLEVLHSFSEERGWKLAVAHLHHAIRGEEADEDLRFVEARARHLGLPFFWKRLHEGWQRGKGGSLEQKARQLRYAFLEECLTSWGGHKVALGHQADDQAETVLTALLRGSGTRGLRGMPYQRGPFVRPLLDVSREEILGFLEQRSIDFRQDSSNLDTTFLRNRIRHVLIPLIRDRFTASPQRPLLRVARLCALDEEFFEEMLEEIKGRVLEIGQGEVEVDLEEVRRLHPALRWRLLRELYREVREDSSSLSMIHVESMDRLCMDRATEERWISLPGGVRFGVSGYRVIVTSRDPKDHPSLFVRLEIPGETFIPQLGLKITLEVDNLGLPSHEVKGGGDRALMDMDAIVGRVSIRGPRPGDRMRPLGMGGSRKIHDILVDLKVPRRLRWRVPLMVDEEGIIWMVGSYMDERVKLTPHTRRVLRVTVEKSQGA